MHCPYHGDSKRSASLNVESGLWNCKGCHAAGHVTTLLKDRDNWVIVSGADHTGKQRKGAPAKMPTEGSVRGWVEALRLDRGALAEFMQRRALSKKTVFDNEIGWDRSKSAYTIPVRNQDGDIANVRWYQLDPSDERRKFWGVTGAESALLYPLDSLSADALLVCEGELDALAAIQRGIPAITRTGAADVWRVHWSPLFAGKRVFICHDMDEKGQHANEVIAAQLKPHAASITIVKLPYEVTKKHGKDITDFFREGNTKEDFLELIRQSRRVRGKRQQATGNDTDDAKPVDVSVGVLDSFDAGLVNRPLTMNVTVTGKRIPSFLVPSKVQFSCDRSMEQKCVDCPLSMTANPGIMPLEIPPSDELILKMIDVSSDDVMAAIQGTTGIKKCIKVTAEVTAHQTVEEIYVRPSIEDATDRSADFTHRKVISLSHDLQSNQTIRLRGTVRPNPKTQANEFQAWEVTKPPSTLDTYTVTEEGIERMTMFQRGERTVMEQLEYIADDLSNAVTLIRGRRDMHIFMDLVLHSALYFSLGNENVVRGWLDGLIVGDTRTGKSEAASKLIDWYNHGEMVSCESASFAGVVGGLDRIGDSRWVVKWGSVPVNDRRAVVLDELTGLQPEQIAQMSSVRSSGIAELTKIVSERAPARTRLLWMGNPRDSKNGMAGYTFGVQAIQPMIGNPEDIARFDMAMGVFSSEVESRDINVSHPDGITTEIPQEAYRELLMWAWTRKASDIHWAKRAVEMALAEATEMGERYGQDPPLIQGANARFKVARVATAIAIRTFSSNSGTDVRVRPEHVKAAVDFLDRVYSNPLFGYAHTSRDTMLEQEETRNNLDEIIDYLGQYRGQNVLRFLRQSAKFTVKQLGTTGNLSIEEANELVAKLYELRAISWGGKDWVYLNPEVVARVREMW